MLFSRTPAVRSAADIEVMRRAGLVVAEMHAEIRAAVAPGTTTAELDRIARGVLRRNGAASNFLGYSSPPYPAVICASVNDVVVHGVPDDDVVLAEGDVVSIDCGAIVEGWHGDAAFTVAVGAPSEADAHLISVTEAALAAGIAAMVEGNRLGDIGAAIEQVVTEAGLGVVEGYTGHAIGRAMHEAPNVPNVGTPGTGARLRAGNVLAIEPMLVTGSTRTEVLDDGWSVVTVDGGRAAHAEHTIAVTAEGPRILTLP